MRQVDLSRCVRSCLGQTEIDHFDFRFDCIAARQHNVTRLQIAMDQAVRCSRYQRARDLNRDFKSQLDIKRTVPPDTRLQSLALDQLHCVIAAIAFDRSGEVKYARHIRMLECCRRPRLAQKPFPHFL